ncbi:Z1 domain-containing protein [Vreelandella malpeensis]|uniref:Z1 domain-containing protein n=1 Tax=Vreelandella malpeensis TaxID=1172368 RepID=A0ABS8DT94_9GAMM|nr:Z1 domain-containing protein [Halomonas malpeensis]MCB8889465.1 Z1 domain-containing protein [Halomonas malpeensis]
MTDQLDMLDNMVSQGLADSARRTPEGIRKLIASVRQAPIFPGVTDDDAEMLAREIEERIGVSMGLGATVDANDFEPWLERIRPEIESGSDPWYYWSRYKKLLFKKKFPQDVIYGTDQVTDTILGRLGNPREKRSWDRKGMVVGHVQSGKTANYTGLVCKAADAGYRLIIVIAGIHSNLRNQTQGRIDEGFIGRDTGRLAQMGTREKPKLIGVAEFDDRFTPVSLTNTIKDFNKTTATSNTSQIASYAVPVVLVIKKNTHTLRNLTEWLREHSANHSSEMVDQPMLLIDDEADNASINVKYGKNEVSRINGQIRELLGLFRRSCYVGYTATPFANIFIDPEQDEAMEAEDLFPRDFIIGLDAPNNYFGPRKVFLDGMPDEEEPLYLRNIIDNEDVLPIRHKIDDDLVSVPPSMIEALRAFLVARTIRDLRGQREQHASMLVNASRFTRMQGLIRNRLQEALDTIRVSIRVNASLGERGIRDPEIAALRNIWAAEFYEAWPDWSEIQAQMLSSIGAAKVVEVNSRVNDLDYSAAGERGLTVIAVGGFSLSRGLTLEGLTVSYFLRNSMMYDTLMQMGRWFGYRGNYEDLCRIWMPPQAIGWYAHIAEATEELHEELRRMQRDKATPLQFGLAVRSHPSSLLVTARNKLGSGEKHVKVGLSNGYVETHKLINAPAVLESNRSAARAFASALREDGHDLIDDKRENGGFLLRDVDVSRIDDFLLRFRNARESIGTTIEPLRRYINQRVNDELDKWDVFFASVKDNEANRDILGWPIGPARRSIGVENLKDGILSVSGSRARVASRGVEKISVAPHDVASAEADFMTSHGLKNSSKTNFPDHIYRGVRKKPLLVLFLLSVKLPDKTEHRERYEELLPKEPVVAFGISFPHSSRPDEKVEYVMNTTMLRELFGEEDQDEDLEMVDV